MGDNQAGEPIHILLVEDNPGDARLTQEAFKEAKILNQLHIVKDGEEALGFLKKTAPFAHVPRPHIILLDLNLPKIDGIQVLNEVKSDPSLKRIPVIILTTSQAEEDIVKTYNLHANCYITKPVDLEQFIKTIISFEQFWLTFVKFPPQ